MPSSSRRRCAGSRASRDPCSRRTCRPRGPHRAEGIQLALQRSDVVTAEVRRVQVERAVAETISGLDELPPRCRARRARRPAGCAEPGTRGRPHQSTARIGRGPPRHRSDGRARSGAPGCRRLPGPRHRGGRCARDESASVAFTAATSRVLESSGRGTDRDRGERSGQVRLDVAQDRVLRLRADHACDLLAALEQDQAGDAHHPAVGRPGSRRC